MTNRKDHLDRGLDFDGLGGKGYSRETKYAGNHFGGVSDGSKEINKGRGPTVGNQDGPATRVGPPATKDAFRAAPDRVKVNGREVPKIKDLDYINGGSQYRGLGGTKVDMPRNIDRINIEPKGTQGFGQSESKNPIAMSKKPGNPDGINYGPKKQY